MLENAVERRSLLTMSQAAAERIFGGCSGSGQRVCVKCICGGTYF